MCKPRKNKGKSQNEQAESEADSERDGKKLMHGSFTELRSFHKINWAPSPVVTVSPVVTDLVWAWRQLRALETVCD